MVRQITVIATQLADEGNPLLESKHDIDFLQRAYLGLFRSCFASQDAATFRDIARCAEKCLREASKYGEVS
jgi:hypothetical protein